MKIFDLYFFAYSWILRSKYYRKYKYFSNQVQFETNPKLIEYVLNSEQFENCIKNKGFFPCYKQVTTFFSSVYRLLPEEFMEDLNAIKSRKGTVFQ